MQSRIDRLFDGIGNCGAVFISGFANVFYYSGFTSDDAFLLITPTQRYIITDSRYFVQSRIEAPDFELIDAKHGWKYVFDTVAEDTIAFEENHLTYGMYKSICEQVNTKRFIPSQREIDLPRRVKDKNELELIKKAESIGDEAFRYVLNKMHVGMSEREIALELEMYMKKEGASGLSFDTISASGVRSSMPHGTATDKLVEKGDLLTLDFGCIYKGYCSDMTRTVVFGTPSDEQRKIYELVLKAQTVAIDALAKGAKCSDIDKTARDIISDAGYAENFGHALGHSVGIDIHEMPTFSPKSNDILDNGNVLSVEPGVYIDGWGGVRIEDLVAVWDDEIVNLTSSPKELIIL